MENLIYFKYLSSLNVFIIFTFYISFISALCILGEVNHDSNYNYQILKFAQLEIYVRKNQPLATFRENLYI